MRRVPRGASTTRPAPFRSRRWRETAGRLIGSASASSWTDRSPAPSSSTMARRLGSPSASNGSPAIAGPDIEDSDGPHPVVLRLVGQLREPERLEQRREVHPESPAIALAEAVPAADRVRLVAAPPFHRPARRGLLLVGGAQDRKSTRLN